MSSARFIVLDGVDGCGKSTQAKALTAALEARGRHPLHLREPGSSAAGEAIRRTLLNPELTLGPATETLLFAAARRQTMEELVVPALAAGRDVVCERFHASTFAYQAFAGELDEDHVLGLLERWASPVLPEVELILTLPAQDAGRRRGAPSDRIEAKGMEFQQRVAEGYARYLELCPRAVAVDARGTVEDVHARVLGVLDA